MNTLIKVLSIALLVSVVGNVWQYFHPRVKHLKGEVVYVPGSNDKPAIVYELPEGNQAIVGKNKKEYKEATEEATKLVNSVKSIPELQDAGKIIALTNTVSKLELELTEKNMTLNDKENDRKKWEDMYNKVSVDNKTNVATVVSEVSPKIATVEKRETFLGPKENYTVVTSENPSIKFYGLESYTFKNPKQKDFLELNVKLQSLYFNKTKVLVPFAEAEIIFNPDGKIKPVGAYGYYYENLSGKLVPYWMLGLEFNILRF